jgi:aromatic-L-amino-acid decarboxylase
MVDREFRAAGHYLVDFIADYLQNVENRPLFPDVQPAFLYELFNEPIPDDQWSLQHLQQQLEEKLCLIAHM